MDKQPIEFRQLRDFSQNINDSFQFIKQEFKPLFRCFLAIAGTGILLSSILSAIYQKNTISAFSSLFSGQRNFNYNENQFGSLYFLMLFVAYFSWVLIHASLGGYIKAYMEKGNQSPTIDEVWQTCKPYLLPLSLYTFVFGLLIGLGTVFCILPGIYLAVVFAPFTMIIIMEDAALGDIFNRCFNIIKDNFWQSFGIYIVSFLIYWMSSLIIGVVIGLFAAIAKYFTITDISGVITAITSGMQMISHLFYIVPFLAIAFNYFNLTEQTDGNGLLMRIDSIGNNNAHNNIEEQY